MIYPALVDMIMVIGTLTLIFYAVTTFSRLIEKRNMNYYRKENIITDIYCQLGDILAEKLGLPEEQLTPEEVIETTMMEPLQKTRKPKKEKQSPE